MTFEEYFQEKYGTIAPHLELVTRAIAEDAWNAARTSTLGQEPIGWRLKGKEDYGVTSYDKEVADRYIAMGYVLVQEVFSKSGKETLNVL